MNKKEFSEVLGRKRFELGLTQHKFADVLGVPHRTYESWENMRCKPPRARMNHILSKIDDLSDIDDMIKKAGE